jgi:hypothetical protein
MDPFVLYIPPKFYILKAYRQPERLPKERQVVTDQPFMFFTLVPQTDRRQVSDRRNFWRGGRRASDVAARRDAIGETASVKTILWAASPADVREKLRLH